MSNVFSNVMYRSVLIHEREASFRIFFLHRVKKYNRYIYKIILSKRIFYIR